jgi:hypothetical protein
MPHLHNRSKGRLSTKRYLGNRVKFSYFFLYIKLSLPFKHYQHYLSAGLRNNVVYITNFYVLSTWKYSENFLVIFQFPLTAKSRVSNNKFLRKYNSVASFSLNYTLFDENIENHACSLALLLVYIDFDKWSQR